MEPDVRSIGNLNISKRVRESFSEESSKIRFRIIVSLIPLLIFYFLISLLFIFIPLMILNIGTIFSNFSIIETIVKLAYFSVLFTIVHYLYVRNWITKNLANLIESQAPDPYDLYHRRLLNIVDEICIAINSKTPEIRIIDSFAMNAFCISDEEKTHIYVTESAVSNLKRDELQAVIAHTIAMQETGDAEVGNYLISMCISFEYLLSKTSGLGLISNNELVGEESKITDYFFPYSFFISIAAFVSSLLTSYFSSFINRDRKHLADLLAVQITRNPEALATALYRMQKISKLKMGLERNILGILCIVPPQWRIFDEKQGFMADLFSVHPPLEERIDRIMSGRFIEQKELDRKGEEEKRYFVFRNEEWNGPYMFQELSALQWLTPESYVCEEGQKEVNILQTMPWFRRFIINRADVKKSGRCPACGGGLSSTTYEGVPIERCTNCAGVILAKKKLRRIQIRKEITIPSALYKDNSIEEINKQFQAEAERICRVCGQTMIKKFYSSNYPVVIDECQKCKLIWLDQSELEKLQVKG